MGCVEVRKKYESVIIISFFMVIMSGLAMAQYEQYGGSNISERSVGTTQALRYVNESLKVNEYNITEVIQKARELEYAIRVGSSRSPPPYKVYNGTSNETLYFNGSLSKYFNKVIGAYDEGYVSFGGSYDNFEFGASPRFWEKDPYLFRVVFVPKNESITKEQASVIVSDELKKLGLLNENATIQFKEEYISPPELFGGSGIGIVNYQTQTILYMGISVVLIIIVVSFIILVKRRSRNEK